MINAGGGAVRRTISLHHYVVLLHLKQATVPAVSHASQLGFRCTCFLCVMDSGADRPQVRPMPTPPSSAMTAPAGAATSPQRISLPTGFLMPRATAGRVVARWQCTTATGSSTWWRSTFSGWLLVHEALCHYLGCVLHAITNQIRLEWVRVWQGCMHHSGGSMHVVCKMRSQPAGAAYAGSL
jgi:hypothetical protein